MGKIATSVHDQINLLKQRGMVITDAKKAEEYLMDIGYYRLGFYWHYFEVGDSHKFQPGIDIETIRALYYFDFDLKYLLSKYIYRIEVHFRTQIVYLVSNKNSKSPTWFVDPNVVTKEMIAVVNSIYYGNDEYFKKNNLAIKNHHKKYINDKFAPAWKTLEFFTFGQINKLFRNIKDIAIQENIANIYGYRDLNIFKNHLSSIVHIRNICSHNSVLFDFNQPVGVKIIPLKPLRIKSRNQTNLNASIHVILSILNTVSENRKNDLINELSTIIDKAGKNAEVKKIIDQRIGYDLK